MIIKTKKGTFLQSENGYTAWENGFDNPIVYKSEFDTINIRENNANFNDFFSNSNAALYSNGIGQSAILGGLTDAEIDFLKSKHL